MSIFLKKTELFLGFAVIFIISALGCSTEMENLILGMHTFTDDRDGRKYAIKDIEGTYWFMENLAYNGKTKYTSDEAVNACPPNWHLPNNRNWESLEKVCEEVCDDFERYSYGREWWGINSYSYSNNKAPDIFWYILLGDHLTSFTTNKGQYYIRCVN